MSVRVQFCGAAGTVTGSCYWITCPGGQFLVDCGLFQGTKTVRELNYASFPFDVGQIEFVLLTHAHTDHSGLLPKLTKAGFEGRIFATGGSRDLLTYMLPDSGYIQETEVQRLNRRNARRGRPSVSPIYTRADAEVCLSQVHAVEFDRWQTVGDGIRVRFWNAGHILGSALVELEIETGKRQQPTLRLLFSGDIGPDNKLFHRDPEGPKDLDYLFCEATYGDRPRPHISVARRRQELAREVTAALDHGGNLLIPSFAVERTQELLLDLSALMDSGAIAEAPIFLDSPLAIRATKVFESHFDSMEDVPAGRNPFGRDNIHFTETPEESKAIARIRSGAIIMAGSGMCDAGRIRHHLKSHLWRRDSTILFVGYQATGTLGHLLLQGKQQVRIHGREIAVKAVIRKTDSYSAHADQQDLLDWIDNRLPLRKGLFLTHGSDDSRATLQRKLLEAGFADDDIFLPQLDDAMELTGKQGPRKRVSKKRLPPETFAHLDWHNDYAQLVIDLQKALYTATDDRKREAILRDIRKALDE
ncbi:MAG: MBL fold metallo-hydrolase [Rhodospirillaceae bacterium]|nr:MBL fold metallo-hydrolase [Rhodospirillaceae bacterium]MDD9915683.1 MBL fold metallo-hydrolase [Rhodospirillaceae bacterium]MDD9927153.1 MBL fold metallo-hydrolase [Rhodospirillaceae bacterium]